MTRLGSTEAAMSSNFKRWAALVVVCLGQLMIMLDTTIVNVALPYMQRDLGFSQSSLTWVVNAYLISYGGFLLVAGRLGDLIGRRKVFLAGIFLFTVASVGGGCGGQGVRHGRGPPGHRTLPPGGRGLSFGGRDHRAHRHRVPEAGRARAGHERLHARDRGRRFAGPPRGRIPDPVGQLALDL